MRRPSRFRLSFAALLPLIVALVAQASYTLVSQRGAMEDGLDRKGRSLSRLLVNIAGPAIAFDDLKGVGESLGYVASDPDFAFAVALDQTGHPIATRGDVTPEELTSLQVQPGEPRIIRLEGRSVAVTEVVTDGHAIGGVAVALRTAGVQEQAAAMAEHAALISAFGILIAVVVVELLSRAIARRNQQMRIVLDNVDEGLATIRPDGRLDRECSAAYAQWFGAPSTSHFATQLAPGDAALRAQLVLAWTDLVEGSLPEALLVMQFPSRLVRDGRHFRLDIKPLEHGQGALLRVRDVTAEVENQRSLEAQREYVAIVERSITDPTSVADFIDDTEAWIGQLERGSLSDVEARRAIHTVKGNAGMFGIGTVADAAHAVEETLGPDTAVDAAVARPMIEAWRTLAARIERFASAGRAHVQIARSELEAVARLARTSGPAAGAQLERWLLDSAQVRFEGLRARIERAAENVCKPVPEIVIADDGVVFEPDRFRPFWDAFSHLVRNALDHGIESEDVRERAGKPMRGRIELRARQRDGAIAIELADDGAGIAWPRVRDKAVAMGLRAETHADLVRALFSDRVSTAAEITTTSGRGVGLAAVESAVTAARGQITVESKLGVGTTFVFVFPTAVLDPARAACG